MGIATFEHMAIMNESESRSVTSTLCDPWTIQGQNTGVGTFPLLQEIFPTQGTNPGLLHCRRILYQLSRKESPACMNSTS